MSTVHKRDSTGATACGNPGARLTSGAWGSVTCKRCRAIGQQGPYDPFAALEGVIRFAHPEPKQ